eukprot:CAMPEP_0176120046 /NCGR_PEP_ID=MMETSP0120_2-20121206/60373_1 /TAXON_ID=160619 /ORGANISM="Kryptoperidinium foliaceum, Strain CCMP 1326" /LENGTH=98 /DNA_ID=CAMNT_0017454479 /DNA_START=192 /DNA_END=484 /DNA_ORIENTATION=+
MTTDRKEKPTTGGKDTQLQDWYTICLDIDKSKFFDPNYAVLEGDIFRDVFVKASREEATGEDGKNDNDMSDDRGRLILKRGERCFVMVRRQTALLFDT